MDYDAEFTKMRRQIAEMQAALADSGTTAQNQLRADVDDLKVRVEALEEAWDEEEGDAEEETAQPGSPDAPPPNAPPEGATS